MDRMCKTLVVPLFAILLGACDSPELDIAAEKTTVAARGKALATAEAARDIETVMSLWTDDAIFQMHGSAQLQGKEAIRGVMQTFFEAFKEFEGSITHIEVAASGDLAFDYGVNRVLLQVDEREVLVTGKYLAIWRKIDETWLISAISVTDDVAFPAPL
jgi:uncharacterized protein (TIGR02246 family)